MYNLNDPKTYIFTKFSLLMPTMTLEELQTDVYSGKFSDITDEEGNVCSVLIDMRPVLATYAEDNDHEILNSYTNSLYESYIKVKGMIVYNAEINLDKVFPIIKSTSFFQNEDSKLLESGEENGFFYKKINNELSIGFTEDFDDSCIYVFNHMLKNKNKDDVASSAFNNLKKSGWVKETNNYTTKNNSQIMIYDNDSLNIAQFLVFPWTSIHISEEFYISFPAESIAIVCKISPNIHPDKKAEDLGKFKQMTLKIYSQSPNKLSNRFYNFSNKSGIVLVG